MKAKKSIQASILGILGVLAMALTLATQNPTNAAAVPADAAATYKAKCVTCHGPKAEKSFNRSKSDDQLLNAALKGVKPKMPSYEKSLGEAACKELVAYMKSLK